MTINRKLKLVAFTQTIKMIPLELQITWNHLRVAYYTLYSEMARSYIRNPKQEINLLELLRK